MTCTPRPLNRACRPQTGWSIYAWKATDIVKCFDQSMRSSPCIQESDSVSKLLHHDHSSVARFTWRTCTHSTHLEMKHIGDRLLLGLQHLLYDCSYLLHFSVRKGTLRSVNVAKVRHNSRGKSRVVFAPLRAVKNGFES